MADFGIDVIIDPSKAESGMDKVDRRLKRTEVAAKRLGSTLRRAFTLVGLIAAARQVGIFADSLTNVQNRIRLVTKNTAQLNAVTQKLFDISARTRTGFQATATIFSRTALAVKDLGLSLNETLGFTEALNQAIVLSGVKAQEANAGLIQLSQGLASGTLRGDELRSVLEQLPKVADLIADELGVARGELRLLGEQGLISTKSIINAFTGIATEDLTKAFADSIPTISQGFSVLEGRVIQYIGKADEATRISEKLARGLIFVAENLETIGKFAIVAGAALVGPFAKAGVLFATRAVLALNAAILANPIGALIVVVLSAIAAIDQFGDELAVTEDGLVSLKDVALATWEFIKSGIQPVVDTIVEGFGIATNAIVDAFDNVNVTFTDVLDFTKTFINRFIGFFIGLGRAMQSIFNDVGEIIRSVMGESLITDIGNSVKALFDFILKGLEVVKRFVLDTVNLLGVVATTVSQTLGELDIPESSFTGNLLRVGQNAKTAFLTGFNQDFVGEFEQIVAPALAKISEDARKISAKRSAPVVTAEADTGLGDTGAVSNRLPFALKNQLRLLDEEAKALKVNNRERGIQNELLELEEKLRKSSLTLDEAQKQLLESRVRNLTALREQAAVLTEIRGPQEELEIRQSSLNALYAEGTLSLAEFTREMLALGVAQSELNIEQGQGSFFDGFLVGIQGMLDAVRNFSSEAGTEFANFFQGTTEGFADAAANAIVFGESFKDAVGNAARSAVADLLSGLIKLGLQFVLNATLGNTLAATATAAGVAQAGVLSAAFASPAALVSLATSGANAIPAQAGIISTTALATSLAAVPGFANGGFVRGPGGPKEDAINANLSNGEFVVNAKSTARFRPQLEAINQPGSGGGGGTVGSSDASSERGKVQGSGQTPQSIRIINVQDPAVVGDFLSSAQGEKVLINVLERNSSSLKQILGNN